MAGSVEVRIERCKGCGLCGWACPEDVLEMVSERTNDRGYVYAVVKNGDKCVGCGNCYTMCPDSCITVFRD